MELGVLANGLKVHYLNWGETRFLDDEIFRDNTYLQHGIELSDGDLVFDVGANIGLFAIFLKQKWPNIRLYSFEPIPDIFRVLRANIELHHVDATLFECGLSDRSGSATFTFYPNNSVMSGRYADSKDDADTTRAFIGNKDPRFMNEAARSPEFAQHADSMLARLFEGQAATVELKTVSEVLASYSIERVDLLKIDVEKSEHEVLGGIDTKDWKRIRQIVIEVHDIAGRLLAIKTLLESQGFQVNIAQDAMLLNTSIYNVYARRSH